MIVDVLKKTAADSKALDRAYAVGTVDQVIKRLADEAQQEVQDAEDRNSGAEDDAPEL